MGHQRLSDEAKTDDDGERSSADDIAISNTAVARWSVDRRWKPGVIGFDWKWIVLRIRAY